MAAPMESIAFCSILNEVDLLRVTEGYTEDTVVLSSKRKLFDVYKISDQKSLKSWSVRHGLTLTSPVVWNPQIEKFVTVVNNQEVRLLDKDNADFEKAKKKQSQTKIYEVMCCEDYEPLILFINGKVSFLSSIKEDQSNGPLSNKEEIFWCKAFTVQSTLIVLYTVITKEGIDLHTNKFNSDTQSWQHTVLQVPLPSTSTTFCSCDALSQAYHIDAFFLWSDGSLRSLRIDEGSCFPGPFHTIPGANKKCSILVVDSSHIAVAGMTDNKTNGLGIFDTKFGLLKSWQPYPDKCLSKPKMSIVRDNLFLPCGTTLYTYKCKCEPSLIVNLLGQASITDDINTQTVPGHYTWNPHNMKCSMSQPSAQVSELLTTLIESSLTQSKFKSVFSKLLVELKKTENHHWLSTSHMTTLLRKMMEEKKFWARDEMNQLIELKCIPLSIIDEIFSVLAQKSEISLLQNLLNTASNIPEKCLCRALSFFIECDEEKLPTVDEIEEMIDETAVEHMDDGINSEENICPFTPHRSVFINEILSLPYSDTFLLECLRKISFKDALKLLDYLCFLLESKSGISKGNQKSKHQRLSQIQIVDWLCLVLDAHITQFVLSPDCHVTVVKLEDVVRKQVLFFDKLVTLEALLEHFKAKSSPPQDKKIGHYCIEVLHV